jgi:GMP synthase (glutamine-hydrolysing)
MLSTVTNSKDETLRQIAEEKRLRKTNSLVLMFSMGSQFDHLIMMQLAKIGVYALVADPAKVTASDVSAINPQGIIVSGGPASVHSEPPPFDSHIFNLGIPTFGICLGFQMWAKYVGANVRSAEKREFNVQNATFSRSELFTDVPDYSLVLQSHGDIIENPNYSRFKVLAWTENSPVAAARCGHLYGVQFHPEVSDTERGMQIFENFCGKICGITDRFPAHDVAARKIEELRRQISDKKVLIALSGGSDSSVVAYLLKHATNGKSGQLKGVYIKGIDRPDDEADFYRFFGNQPWIDIEVVDGTERFLRAFVGVTKSDDKRVAMQGVYHEILEEKIHEHSARFIAQGTLYTDLVESGHGIATGARKARIKRHHNTGLEFSVPELTPLDDCVKDNARAIGRDVEVPEELLIRHPFPGPGQAIRIEGEVTAEMLRISRAADRIVIEELREAGLYEEIWQAGARVMRSQHTTTKGDDAGVGWCIGWFAVTSVNGFTARAYDVPFHVRQRIADRMGNEIREVGATYFKDSGKPYSTIEAE